MLQSVRSMQHTCGNSVVYVAECTAYVACPCRVYSLCSGVNGLCSTPGETECSLSSMLAKQCTVPVACLWKQCTVPAAYLWKQCAVM